jgi:hypothetical protein
MFRVAALEYGLPARRARMRPGQQADWRSKDSYAYAANLTRLGWAWEFLRRNPRFQADFERQATAGRAARSQRQSRSDALRSWGLLRADTPSKNASEAKVFWDPKACAHVLPLVTGQGTVLGHVERFTSQPVAHVLICDGTRRLQLSIRLCAATESGILLTEAIAPPRQAPCRWRSLICFNDYFFSGSLPQRHFRSERTAGRLARVAQALDGALRSASHREIAIALYGRVRVSDDWNDPGEYLRDGVRRAVRRGRLLMNGGYRQFLG